MFKVFSFVIILILNSVSYAAIVGQWKPLYPGIDHAVASSDSPRLQRVNALRIDLSNPEIHFYVSPKDNDSDTEVDSQTTGEFLEQYCLQAAVNANFFKPCCSEEIEPKDVIGLSMSNGNLVSTNYYGSWWQGSAVMLIDENNLVLFADAVDIPNDYFVQQNFKNAIAGGPILLEDGQIAVAEEGDAHPRTAAGTSEDKRYLYLITIDGRQEGFSEGATYYETANWLLLFGAHDGINLDGGGSTTMVKADANHKAQVLNSPSDGQMRLVATSLGVFSQSASCQCLVPGGMEFDYNGDCQIDLEDLRHFVSEWLSCRLYPDCF